MLTDEQIFQLQQFNERITNDNNIVRLNYLVGELIALRRELYPEPELEIVELAA